MRGMTGSMPLYDAIVIAGETIDPTGPAGSVSFTVKVVPYSVAWVVTARGLDGRTEYAIVNPFRRDGKLGTEVNVLGTGFSNRAGLLCVRGGTTQEGLAEWAPTAWSSGAQVSLVPANALRRNDDRVFVPDGDENRTLYSALGVPILNLPD